MNRDLRLIMEILAYVDEHGIYEGDKPVFPSFAQHERPKVLYHLALCRDENFITDMQLQPAGMAFRNLTWAGHNILAQLRATLEPEPVVDSQQSTESA